MDDEYLSPKEVVARYKGQIKSVGTLANWRISKQGPPYTKIGGRVVYPLEKLKEWEKSRTFGTAAVTFAAVLGLHRLAHVAGIEFVC